MKKFIDKLVILAVEKAYVLKIVLILVASSILFISYLFFETNDYINVQTEVIKNNKKTFLKDSITEMSNAAKLDGEMKVKRINDDIAKAYPAYSKSASAKLKVDLKKYVTGDVEETPLSKIMYENTQGQYFNINNDNNDPFVVAVIYHYDKSLNDWVSTLYITSDYSINCLTPKPRTIEQEINGQQTAKGLVRPALEGIVLKGADMKIWHFVDIPKDAPWYTEIVSASSMSLDKVADLADKYGIEAIRGFEYLQAVRMNETEDISRTSIYKGGSQLNTDAIILYYFNNFNFIDQLTIRKDVDMRLQDFDKEITEVIRQANNRKVIYIVFLIFDTLLVIMSTYALEKKQ